MLLIILPARQFLSKSGFISNPEERKALMTAERKQKTAEAVAKGILKYLGKD